MYSSTSKKTTILTTNNQCEQSKYNCNNNTQLHSCISKESRSKSPTQKTSEYSTHNARNSATHIESNVLTLGNENNHTSQSSTSGCYGPTLPPYLNLSPEKAPKFDVYGPALPSPNTHEQNLKTKVYGPTFPLHMTNVVSEASLQKNPNQETQNLIDVCPRDETTTTPILEDEECWGPLPPNIISQSEAYIALEERALQIKLDQLQKRKQDHVSREEWMLELPEIRSKHLALGPRQFRANPGPDFSDRSSWTNIPTDKINQKSATHKLPDLKDNARKRAQEQYDKEQEVIVKKHKKHKKEKSLLEIHQSNLMKQTKGESSIRRPFSREIDLKVNHFDKAQKEAILKKAQLLDDRFSKGQSKFL